MKTYIKIKTNFVGMHKWDNAPEEVSFLRNLHRHIFNVNVKIEVLHNDRELEYFMFKKTVDNYICHNIIPKLWKDPRMSCEMMAEPIVNWIINTYAGREIEVEVNEDNENGSIVTHIPNQNI